jgi:hypothetical protein
MRPDLAYRDLDEVPLSSLTCLTVTRRVVGTPIYLSPEAARGDDPDPLFDLRTSSRGLWRGTLRNALEPRPISAIA